MFSLARRPASTISGCEPVGRSVLSRSRLYGSSLRAMAGGGAFFSPAKLHGTRDISSFMMPARSVLSRP
eukprot:5795734-Prymnesium_polylepis.1